MSHTFVPIIEGYPTSLKGYSIYTNSTTQLVDQRSALINDDWSLLEDLANQGIGAAHGYFREIRRSNTVPTPGNAFLNHLNTHATGDSNSHDFFELVKSKLLELDPNIDPELLGGLDQMAEGKNKGTKVHELVGLAGSTAPQEAQVLEDAIGGATALAAKSLLAIAHTNFNNHHSFLNEVNAIDAHGDEFYKLLRSPTIKFGQDLNTHMKEIYTELLNNQPPQSSIEKLMSFVEEYLPTLSRIQATIRQYAIALDAAGKGTASEKAGALAVEAGSITRDAIAAYASSIYLSMQSALPKPTSKAKKLLQKSDRLSFDTNFPNGKDLPINKVSQAADGDYIEVIGKVTAIQTGRDSDNKLVSQVTLYDPSSQTSTTVAGVYAHFRHLGLLEDSYCRVSGIWQSQSAINKGNPAIEIEKLSLNDLAKQSWRVAFLDLSDKYFDRWPVGLNIQFGLAPHVSAPEGNQDESAILGAGELIFKPFYR